MKLFVVSLIWLNDLKEEKTNSCSFFAPSHVMEIDLTSLSCSFQPGLIDCLDHGPEGSLKPA